MSYCRECGAYIPDGETACVACGWSESSNSGAFAQKKAENRENKYEEENTTSASSGYRRRYDYESASARHRREDRHEDRRGAARYYSDGYAHDAKTNRGLACLCYLGPLFVVPWLLRPNSQFIKYHVNQGLVLFLFWLLLGVFEWIPVVGWLGFVGDIIGIVGLISGLSNASKGRRRPIPLIGDITLIK